MNTDKKLIQALRESIDSERNLSIATFLKRLYDMQQKQLLNQEEFDFAKHFLLTYDNNRIVDDYGDFLDAILILQKSLSENIIDAIFYTEAAKETLCMKKDKFLAQLLYACIITPHDYKHSDKSSLVESIRRNDIATFGSSTPTKIAIILSEKYGFKTIKATIKNHKQKIVTKKGNKYFIINKSFNLFGTARLTIKDENNIDYSYKELINKLEHNYGTL